MSDIEPYPDFLIWRCCGCGAPAAGKKKPCDCATNVGYRKGPNGKDETTWWADPPPPEDPELARLRDLCSAYRGQVEEGERRIAAAEAENERLRGEHDYFVRALRAELDAVGAGALSDLVAERDTATLALSDLRAAADAAGAYRAAESDGTPRMFRGKDIQDLANDLDDKLAALSKGPK